MAGHGSWIGSGAAMTGAMLLFIGTSLHPMDADPNVPALAFAEYAADRHWVTSHLVQLAGVALMVAALVLLSSAMHGGPAATWAVLGQAGAVASLAVAAALQAVDGVALKAMVDAWAAAPAPEKPALFHAAFAVRQIEIGLASMVSLLFGSTAMLYGAATVRDGRFPRWTAALAIGGGAGTFAGGLALAHSGFSPAAQTVNLASSAILLLWMIAVGIYGWRRHVF